MNTILRCLHHSTDCAFLALGQLHISHIRFHLGLLSHIVNVFLRMTQLSEYATFAVAHPLLKRPMCGQYRACLAGVARADVQRMPALLRTETELDQAPCAARMHTEAGQARALASRSKALNAIFLKGSRYLVRCQSSGCVPRHSASSTPDALRLRCYRPAVH